MKTAIIDRSMVGMRIFDNIKKADVYLYACALLEAGADYVEIDLSTLSKLPKPNGSENYIYRIEHPDEIIIANAFPFKYAVVPLKYSYLINKINIPVILETPIGDIDLMAYIKVIADNIDLTKVALLRLVGDFNPEKCDLKTFMHNYVRRYSVPIDFCPLNMTMQALSSAISAYFAMANSITLSFGANEIFTPLEDFLITMATTYKKQIHGNYIAGICKSSIIASIICGAENNTINQFIKIYQLSPKKIPNIDFPTNASARAIRKTTYARQLPGEKYFSEMEFDDEIIFEISQILKKIGIGIYDNTTEKKSFLN